MERILIIGCSGSGKTTLSRALGEKMHLPVVHLDRLWWTGDWENVTREEFDARLSEALEQPKWIIDGNYSRTIPMRLPKCDTIIYLDFNRWECLLGMLQRVTRFHGRKRPDMGGDCRERFDPEFARWIWNFNKTKRQRIYDMLSQYPSKDIHIFKSRKEVKVFLENL